MKSTRRVLGFFVRSFARTAHSFAYSALLALLAYFAALICLLACSLIHFEANGNEVFVLNEMRRFYSLYVHSALIVFE